MAKVDLLVDLYRDGRMTIPDGSSLRITDDQSILAIEGPYEYDILIEGLSMAHKVEGAHNDFMNVNRMLCSGWTKPLIPEQGSIFEQVNYHRYPDCRCIGCGCSRR